MNQTLSPDILKNLVLSVFSPGKPDKSLGILIDVPDTTVPDNEDWKTRRQLAAEWVYILSPIREQMGIEKITLFAYPNVHSNNADLPSAVYTIDTNAGELSADLLLTKGQPISFKQCLSENQMIMAMTEFSATAPLKLLAKDLGFRAATMPGFSNKMLPALMLDYNKVHDRVMKVKNLLDDSESIDIEFRLTDGALHKLHVDIRFREAHASSGRFPEQGTAGNFPSGECYIVPYEGELEEDSKTEGVLPVQMDNEIVLYRIIENRAKLILSKGTISDIEREKIKSEPAYSNISEIGFGVLKDFGLNPIGEILLDEKLGLHIAFGRSDHFGGSIGPSDFTSPSQVIHIDRIYLPQIQNKITIEKVILNKSNEESCIVMQDNEYTIF